MNDVQVLRANGNNYVVAQCVRGNKQVSSLDLFFFSCLNIVSTTHSNSLPFAECIQVIPKQFHEWATALQPDIVFALPDVPYTPAPYSQKRITKSNERTIRWLTDLVISREIVRRSPNSNSNEKEAAIFAHLLGGSVQAAREAYAESMLETLIGREADSLPTLDSIDDAVNGYVIDLVPIRLALSAPDPLSIETEQTNSRAPLPTQTLTPLLHASLRYLPESKPRLVTGTSTPHEILRLVKSSGIDIFDSAWAQRAADHGVALDFRFPAPVHSPRGDKPNGDEDERSGKMGKASAINLYDEQYAMDFGPLSTALTTPWALHQQALLTTATTTQQTQESSVLSNDENRKEDDVLVCHCLTCSPEDVSSPTIYSNFERSHLSSTTLTSSSTAPAPTISSPPIRHFTRAYIHHLLHTHEMTAHTFLVAHNLSVLETFFAGIRNVLASDLDDSESLGDGKTKTTRFEREVECFERYYDERLLWGSTAHTASSTDTGAEIMHEGEVIVGVLEEGERRWREVEDLRGKGRLKREKEAALLASTGGGDGEAGTSLAADAVAKASIGEGTSVVPGEKGVEAGFDA